MSAAPALELPPSLLQMIWGDGSTKRPIGTALFGGTLLTAINHGAEILVGQAPAAWKVILTFCVPYCVTIWGAILGKRAQWCRDWDYRGVVWPSENR